MGAWSKIVRSFSSLSASFSSAALRSVMSMKLETTWSGLPSGWKTGIVSICTHRTSPVRRLTPSTWRVFGCPDRRARMVGRWESGTGFPSSVIASQRLPVFLPFISARLQPRISSAGALASSTRPFESWTRTPQATIP